MPYQGNSTRGWADTGPAPDVSKISMEGREPLLEGLYELKVIRAVPKETKDGKNKMISISYEAIGTDDNELKDCVGKSGPVYDNFVLSDEGGFRYKQFLFATGMEPLETLKYDEVEEFCRAATGKVVKAMIARRVDPRFNQGKPQANISYYSRDGEPPKDADWEGASNGASRDRGRKEPARDRDRGRSARR